MNSRHWSQTDRVKAQDCLDEAPATPWLDCKNGLIAIRPPGIFAFGMRFHGGFMLAPLPVLASLALMTPVFVASMFGILSTITLGVALLFLALLWGLKHVFYMLIQDRDLFPLKYFSTLGSEGVAMHFSRFHFPNHDSQAWLDWKEVATVQRITGIFVPAWITGRFHVPLLEVRSTTGKTVVIPILQPSQQEQDMQDIENFIREKTRQQKLS